MTLETRTAEPASGGPARQLVILLHGYGSDANDLISLAPHWASFLPEAAFVSANAPEHCEMAPYGFQWFSLLDRDPAAMKRGANEALPVLQEFIDQQLAARGLDETGLALVGFSQGAMMAFHAAPRRRKACAAVIGYSGALLDTTQMLCKPPVLIVHGTADPVVDFTSLEQAREGFEEAGFRQINTLERPGLGHGIDPEGLMAGGKFLQRQLLAKAA